VPVSASPPWRRASAGDARSRLRIARWRATTRSHKASSPTTPARGT